MNSRQLRHFLALLQEGSLSAAATSVFLSQPALSRSVRALEESLGVPLFDRSERRLKPTVYAWAFAERARRIVFEEQEGIRALELMRSGDAGTLSYGMGASLASVLLKPMMLELLGASPQLKQRSVVESSDRLMQLLLEEQLDFFVGDIRVAACHPDTVIEPIYRCSFGWYARTAHPLATLPKVTIDDLKRFPLIATGYLEESLARRFLELYGLAEPFVDHFAMVVGDMPAVQDVVTSTDAVLPSTDFAMLASQRAGRVVTLHVMPLLDMELTLGIVRLKGRTLIPAAERAFAIVRERLTQAHG
ncbi:HTH-type transcriptional regulator CynR [Paraburkholderia caffeinitolerans]|uniref:HTH-type transcriptional regulator CynR n=1 Tax=Paraburkholderia caffeinitolerans TaxID=1723730 RepID=A0A6J5GQN6_9BURK|nr:MULTISPECIES: LysR family transcriptional regulator [Paraburkholderia]CAB3805489.1 HTH-type transcriptional regulator CynR [Paraburkholderia caffeinitolerans]